MKKIQLILIIAISLFPSFTEAAFITNSLTKWREEPTVSIDTSRWYLKRIITNTGLPDINEANVYIRFDRKVGRVSGESGCNIFGGTLKMDTHSLHVSQVFSTKMYCDGTQEIENNFFLQLGNVTRFEIKNNKLLLLARNELLMELTKEKN